MQLGTLKRYFLGRVPVLRALVLRMILQPWFGNALFGLAILMAILLVSFYASQASSPDFLSGHIVSDLIAYGLMNLALVAFAVVLKRERARLQSADAEEKNAEQMLRESEQSERRKLDGLLSAERNISEFELSDLIDVEAVQSLADSYCRASGLPVAILDRKGKVLIASGWQKICTQFHRVNPRTCLHCLESDTILASGVCAGESKLYKCKNNMWDAATPIIVSGRHLGNVYIGQFFFDDETIDTELFRKQAEKYGFNVEEYLAALRAVPRVSREAVKEGMFFFVKLAAILSNLTLSNAKLAKLLNEREQLMNSFRESEERFRTLADNISQLAWMADAQGEIIWFNKRWYEYTGACEEDVRGWGWNRLLPRSEMMKVTESARQCINEGRDWEGTFRIRDKDGNYRWFLSRAVPIRDDKGSIMRWFGTNTDITDCRAAESRFSRLYESGIIGVFFWESGGAVTDANSKFLDIVGCSQAELDTGLINWKSMTVPEYADIDRAALDALKANGVAPIMEKEYIRKDGIRVPVLIGTAASDEAGERGVAFVLDISDRKRLEEELRAAIVSAERAKEVAEEASRAKDHFLATLSHELRTPLTPVLAAVQLMERNPTLPEELRAPLDVVHRNIGLEARLIDDLLDLTRIVRGKINLERKPTDVRLVIERVIEICRADVEMRKLDMRVEIRDEPVIVYADSFRLQQVFWNLINNSVKFTPEGGRLVITVCKESHLGKIEISDTGIGLEPELISRIFDAFEQGGKQVTRQFGGLGLGLAITKKLVEMHGGTICAHSPGRNQGSTFKVLLPLLMEEANEVEAEVPVKSCTKGGSKQLLLVEDHGDTAITMQMLLESAGYDVHIASDVGQALNATASNSFDLLISDLGLPDRSGLELMKELRLQGNTIKGIALSGFGREEDVRRSIESGFCIHLTKPVDFDVLVRTIQEII